MLSTETIWNNYSDDLRRFIFSKIKDNDITEDLLQDVFIKVHTKITSLQEIEKIKSWLFSVARNTVLDYFRVEQRKVNIEQNNDEIADENNLIFKEHTEQDCLYGIIKNLPKKYRDPLFMANIKGIKQTLIAETLKLPIPTIKSQIQRAKKMVAQGFVDCCGYELNQKGLLVGEIKSKEDCRVCN